MATGMTISRETRLHLACVLRAAEAALRRLIMLFVIANGIKAGLYNRKTDQRPLPDFASFKRAENPLPKFNLIDPRPSLTSFLILSLSKNEKAQSGQTLRQAQGECLERTSHISPTNLFARLQALDHALNTLPQQARRMAREIEKRARARALPVPEDKPLLGPWADPPIRRGKPPGHRDRPKHDVDYVLQECHGLMKDIKASPS